MRKGPAQNSGGHERNQSRRFSYPSLAPAGPHQSEIVERQRRFRDFFLQQKAIVVLRVIALAAGHPDGIALDGWPAPDLAVLMIFGIFWPDRLNASLEVRICLTLSPPIF